MIVMYKSCYAGISWVSGKSNSLSTLYAKTINLIFLAFLLSVPVQALADTEIQVLGLFRDKAFIEIDGTQHFLEAGKPGPQDIMLIESNSRRAIIKVDGEEKVFNLGSQVGATYSDPASTEVRIPSRSGMYMTSGLINGLNVEFLVDTGATFVAVSRYMADKIGIDYLVKGKPTRVSTASGKVDGWVVKLQTVQVGSISLDHVDGVVVDSEYDQQALLGMSFLSRLKVTQEASMIVLEKNH
ncbi:MAG: TIGR02281 family clan AA aspartic protease [Gammaproteobacteria bacterium]|nr:MAG: TIGR02281 family clan AA aspartic protease [Gammaproteobacteria bacterium]